MNNKYWNKKRVMVIGGSGFIGSWFVEYLSNYVEKVVCTYRAENKTIMYLRSLGKPNIQFLKFDGLVLSSMMQNTVGINVLIHCAAQDGNTEYKRIHSEKILQNNVRLALNVLEAANINAINDLVLIGTTQIYTRLSPVPASENDDQIKLIEGITDGYVLSKRIIETLGEYYNHSSKIKVYLPRLSNTYGPRDEDHLSQRIVPKIFSEINQKKEITLWGDGEQKIALVYILDVIRIILSLVEKGIVGKVNVTSDESVTINQLVSLISAIVGEGTNSNKNTHIDITRNNIYSTELMHKHIDFTMTSLLEGLSMVNNYFYQLEKND